MVTRDYQNSPHTGLKGPKPIGSIIDKVVRSLGMSRDYYGWVILSQWDEIVGDDIARQARAVRFEDGTLVVAVPDAAWRQNLSMETEMILKKIHSVSHGQVIKKLRLIHGEKGK